MAALPVRVPTCCLCCAAAAGLLSCSRGIRRGCPSSWQVAIHARCSTSVRAPGCRRPQLHRVHAVRSIQLTAAKVYGETPAPVHAVPPLPTGCTDGCTSGTAGSCELHACRRRWCSCGSLADTQLRWCSSRSPAARWLHHRHAACPACALRPSCQAKQHMQRQQSPTGALTAGALHADLARLDLDGHLIGDDEGPRRNELPHGGCRWAGRQGAATVVGRPRSAAQAVERLASCTAQRRSP